MTKYFLYKELRMTQVFLTGHLRHFETSRNPATPEPASRPNSAKSWPSKLNFGIRQAMTRAQLVWEGGGRQILAQVGCEDVCREQATGERWSQKRPKFRFFVIFLRAQLFFEKIFFQSVFLNDQWA